MIEARERLQASIDFRKATSQDADIIDYIEKKAHPLPEEANQRFDAVLIRDILEEYERDGENHSFIAYAGDVPIGHMLMTAHLCTEGKEYRIASWSVDPNYRSFQTASAMIKHAFTMGERSSTYRAWAREKTVMQRILKPGISDWLARQGYEISVDQNSRKDSGGESHVSVKIVPKQ